MLVLTRADVEAVLDLPGCEAAMAEALAGLAEGTYRQPLRVQFAPEGATARLGLMPSYRAAHPRLYGIKSVMVAPSNRERGLDTHQGAILLHDGEDGRVLAVVDATAVTAIRTAAVSAVATRRLARPDARVVAVFGTGTQARAHIAAMRGVFPHADIRIWGRSAARAQALADATGGQACTTAAAAASGADVLCTVTAAALPILHQAMVSPGCHVNAVGGSAPDVREIAGDLVAASSRFVDSRVQAAVECGEFRMAERDGLVGPDDPVVEIGEVLLGRYPGRTTPSEITLFKSLGLAATDLAAAALAMREALRRGIGQVIDS